MKARSRIVFLLFLAAISLIVSGCGQRATPIGTKTTKLPLPASTQFIKFKTADDITLSGRLFGQGKTGIVLGHMYPADQNSFSKLARNLSEAGYQVLTFDFRGYGLSDGIKDIPRIDKDMMAARRWLAQRTNKVFLIGASMGGTAALKTAARERVAGVATLSAPVDFMGLKVANIRTIKGPKLFIAAAEDDSAGASARAFYAQVEEPKELEILPGRAHGTDMLKEPPSQVETLLLEWLKRYDY